MKEPDILFVGAGPVGLLAAIQMKLHDPKSFILMLEKYKDYQRKHPLILNKDSFVDTHKDPEFQALINSLPKTIRTNELEEILLEFARKIGIEIEYTNVTDCNELAKKYSSKIIIGADGAHSIVRKQIFNDEYQIKKTLQYICEIKYEVEGKTRYLNTITEGIPALSYANHLISEFVGKEKEGKTPVSIRIFIDEETYKKMQEATFKNPYNLKDKAKIESELYESINAWVTARRDFAQEKMIKDSERISVTNLPVYACKKFVKNANDKTWFLVGDAAFGVPFFRSLNNGILCSSQLAKTVHAMFNGIEIEDSYTSFKTSSVSKREITPAQYYENYVQALVRKENFVASVKSVGVGSLESSAHFTQAVPLSRKKLIFTEEGKNFKTHMNEQNPSLASSPFSKFAFSSKQDSSQDASRDEDSSLTSGKKFDCTII